MDKKDILSRVDHTLLKQTATWEQIEKLCREGLEYAAASVCIPPCYVKQAKDFVGDKLAVCTVIGFPNGNMTTAVKVFETEDAVKNGADEIDMVINIGLVKAGHYDQVLDEIRQIKAACGGCLKVIIETCLLTEEEKKEMCRVVTESGADFIKTSTGFSTAGATPEDVALMRKYSGPEVKVKAAGGIASIEDAQRFIELGADRLGTSRLIP
jgi:deoxyribose-phosphate aldolase